MPGLGRWSVGPCCGCTSPSCVVPVTVRGCTGGVVGAGAIVSVWTDATKATLRDSQVTNSSGVASVDVGTAGTYYREISHPSGRFATHSATVAFACGTGQTVSLTAAAGFICAPNLGCVLPLPSTLHYSLSLGTVADDSMVWNAALSRWISSTTWAFPGNSSCGPASVSFEVRLAAVSVLTVEYGSRPGFPACPGAGASWGAGTASSTGSSCTPALLATYIFGAGYSGGDIVTISITE